MEYRRLGRSGLKVSELALGTMNFGLVTDDRTSALMVATAIDAGINLIDCADVYAGGRSEEILGAALSDAGKRHQVLITSKVFMPMGSGPNDSGNSKHRLLNACEASLRRLKTDVIDIYLLHRTDFDVPQEETLAALDLLVRQGKIRYAACSTHPTWRVVEAFWLADRYGYPKFVCEQPPYNLLDRRAENDIFPMCQAYDLGVMAWSPLAQGVLAGRYHTAGQLPDNSRGTQKPIYADRITQAGIEAAGRLSQLALRKNCTPAQLAVAWVLHQPVISSVIIGPRTLDHLNDLLVAGGIGLERADLQFCDQLVPPGRFVSDHFNTAGWIPKTAS